MTISIDEALRSEREFVASVDNQDEHACRVYLAALNVVKAAAEVVDGAPEYSGNLKRTLAAFAAVVESEMK